MVKVAGPMIWSGKKCAYCGKEIVQGDYAIQIGFFRRKYYHRECYVKVKGASG